MRTYEALIIFADSVKEDNVEAALDAFKAEIEKQGGTIQERQALGRRNFARPMRKRDSGQYGKVLFDLSPDKIAPLRQRCKFVDVLFRIQIIARPGGVAPASAPADAAETPPADAAETPPADAAETPPADVAPPPAPAVEEKEV